MFSIKIKCPYCIHHVHLAINRVNEYVSREPLALNEVNQRGSVTSRSLNPQMTVVAHSTATCPECHGAIMVVFKCQYADLQKIQKSTNDTSWILSGSKPEIMSIFPELKEPDDSPHYPVKIRQTFVELQEDIQMKRTAPRIVVGCRSVLEVALRDLGYEKGNLLSRIESARNDGILTESMKDWAHRIRMDGNEAVHELDASNTEAAEFVAFLKLFLEVSFVLPRRVNDAQQERP